MYRRTPACLAWFRWRAQHLARVRPVYLGRGKAQARPPIIE
jgi:hypothetical protein